jgi:transcriptional regulator GlxA family with amidase domain
MSRRSFTRRFQQVTGTTFTQWLLNQRLSVAQRFLEKTDQSVERIAQEAGFGSALSMRRHFQQQFKTSPSLYRREFKTHGE